MHSLRILHAFDGHYPQQLLGNKLLLFKSWLLGNSREMFIYTAATEQGERHGKSFAFPAGVFLSTVPAGCCTAFVAESR